MKLSPGEHLIYSETWTKAHTTGNLEITYPSTSTRESARLRLYTFRKAILSGDLDSTPELHRACTVCRISRTGKLGLRIGPASYNDSMLATMAALNISPEQLEASLLAAEDSLAAEAIERLMNATETKD